MIGRKPKKWRPGTMDGAETAELRFGDIASSFEGLKPQRGLERVHRKPITGLSVRNVVNDKP